MCALSCSLMSDSLQPHEVVPHQLCCPWNFPGKNNHIKHKYPRDKKYFENEFECVVKAEFSKYKRADITACFGGHYHADFEQYSKTSVPFIYTGNVIMYEYRVPRIDGDKSELLFDVVTIDKEKRTIFMTRIGAGEDRKIQYSL